MTKSARRFCTIFGGPNGSGKTTLYRLMQPKGAFVNADEIARDLNPDNPALAAIAAGRLVLDELDRLISAGEDFVYETTLTSHQVLAVMKRCRAQVYRIGLVFVALDDADLNIRRIAQRVACGGHHIPLEIVRRRAISSFGKLPHALHLADEVLLVDNSGLRPTLLAAFERGVPIENQLDPLRPFHARFIAALEQAK